MRDEKNGWLNGNGLRKAKKIVQSETGVPFDLRKGRRTFGQNEIDDGVYTDRISVRMGHASTRTTERNYCRLTQKVANDEAREIQIRKLGIANAEKPFIENWDWVSG